MDKALRNLEFQVVTNRLEKASKGKRRLIRGYASVGDVIDRQNEVITLEALNGARDDLLNNFTVFYEHKHSEPPIGKVIDAKVDSKGLLITVELSKTAETIWTLIEEGILHCFSIGGRVVGEREAKDESTGNLHKEITKINLFEVSVVGLPACAEAQFELVSKSFNQAITESINRKNNEKENITEERKGGEKVTKEKKLEKDLISENALGVPKSEDEKVETKEEVKEIPEVAATEVTAEKETAVTDEPVVKAKEKIEKSEEQEAESETPMQKEAEIEKEEKVAESAPESESIEVTLTDNTADIYITTSEEEVIEESVGTEEKVPEAENTAEETSEEKQTEALGCTECDWEGSEDELKDDKCPECGADVEPIYPENKEEKVEDKSEMKDASNGGPAFCVCPSCGTEVEHVSGEPCRGTKCPECGETMVGKVDDSSENEEEKEEYYYYYFYDEEGNRQVGRRPYQPKHYPDKPEKSTELADDKYNALAEKLDQVIGKLDALVEVLSTFKEQSKPEETETVEPVVEESVEPEKNTEPVEETAKEEAPVEEKAEKSEKIEKKEEVKREIPERKSVRIVESPYGDETKNSKKDQNGTSEEVWKTLLFNE